MQHSQQSGVLSPAALAYELYVHDERYAVPTLHLLSADTEFEARRLARACLAETRHHQRVELWLGDNQVAAWTRDSAEAA